jgi:hypothetical protein
VTSRPEIHDGDGIMCPQCAYFMPPRPSPLNIAGHAAHHRRAHHIAARLRNVPITRSELEEYLRLLDCYVRELELQASQYRGEIADLEDVVRDLGHALAEVGTDEYEADLDPEGET